MQPDMRVGLRPISLSSLPSGVTSTPIRSSAWRRRGPPPWSRKSCAHGVSWSLRASAAQVVVAPSPDIGRSARDWAARRHGRARHPRTDRAALRVTAPGKMHACGHDGIRRCCWGRRVPGAEPGFRRHLASDFPAGPRRGARRARHAGGRTVRPLPCDSIYGLHNTAGMPVGTFASLHRTDAGRRGFLARHVPRRGWAWWLGTAFVDDITYAHAHFILGLQGIVGRNIAPLDTAVLSVGHISAGSADAPNVVPSELLIARHGAQLFATGAHAAEAAPGRSWRRAPLPPGGAGRSRL